MVLWILNHHNFIILGMAVLTLLIVSSRDFYRTYKRKHNLPAYRWERPAFVGFGLYLGLEALVIGIMLGGRVI